MISEVLMNNDNPTEETVANCGCSLLLRGIKHVGLHAGKNYNAC